MMKKKAEEFNNILDECLELVLHDRATVEQCLERYPEQAAELEPLLRTAMAGARALDIRPRPEFRERARYQFQAALRDMEAEKSRGFSLGWAPRWAVAVVVAVVVLVGGGGGTVAAASDSLPDETLYPVKLATETVQLAFTFSALDKAELYVEFADRRVAEIIEMANRGNAEQVERVAGRLNSYLMAMADLAGTDGDSGEEGILMMQAASEEMAVASDVEDSLAVPAATAPPSVTVAAPATTMPSDSAPEADAPAPEASVTVPEIVVPAITVPARKGPEVNAAAGGDDAGNNGRRGGRMSDTISESAMENLGALQEEMDNVPDSVRDALRRAIEEMMAGYQNAISQWQKNR